jgi:PAS domain S-box-containing protein
VTLLVGQAVSLAGNRKRQCASRSAGCAAAAIGAVALFGRWAELPLLLSWGRSLPAMRVSGALCLVVLGLALACPGKGRRFAAAAGVAVGAFALFVLITLLLHISSKEWLPLQAVALAPPETAFRVAHAATLGFMLSGASLAFGCFARYRLAATVLAGLGAAIAVFALLGYLTGIDTLYDAASVAPPPLPTAAGLFCVALGIILQVGAMPALRTPRPLWHLLAALGCATVVPLLLFGAYAEVSIADAQFDEARKGLILQARALSAEVDREILGEIERLEALAASPSLRDGDFAAFHRQAAASLISPRRGNIMLVDSHMQPLVDTGVPYGTPTEELAVTDAVVKALATGAPQFTDPFIESSTQQVMFSILVPVNIDGENRYALVRSANQRALTEPIAADKLPPGWQAMIAGADHHVLAASRKNAELTGTVLPADQWPDNEPSGTFEFTDSAGRLSLEAYALSDLTGWEAAVWEPKSLLEAPVQALWRTLGVVALLALALVIALAMWLGRLIARSVGHAASAATAPEVGDSQLPEGTPVAEVNALMAKLREVMARRQASEDLLRASEVTFRQLVDNSPFGIYAVDADLRVVQASIGARKAFESVQPLIGRDLVEVLGNIWPESMASEVIGRFRHTLATGEPCHTPGNVAQRKDTGAVETSDWKIERVTMPDGRSGVVCHFYDLSERQKYEAALRESEATFRAMFDCSAVGKAEIEVATGRFVRVNAAMCRFVGYSEAELLSRTVFDITHPNERERDRESLRRMDAGILTVFDREKRYVRKDGGIVWARVTANCIRSEYGQPVRNTAVIQDIGARKQTELELEASRTRLQLALDAARLGSFQYDPLRGSRLGDARFREILDLTADETPDDQLIKRVHPDDVEMVKMHRAETLNPTDPKPVAIEHRIVRRDGAIRWVEIHGLGCFEGAGGERRAVRVIGTAQDITERKRHEEQTQLLMREVNHRAKNMLSVVDAIAHQTAARNPDDFIDRFSERIQALSANQDLLVRNEWNGVGIADLVCAQLAHFADLVGSRIIMRGPQLRLKAASAQAIGLALHELSTNAGKYGALSADQGRVDISWRIDGDAFHMSWVECDGPVVSVPTRRGFGTVVMEAMAERTVGGKVDLDYAPSGVLWSLTCPAANALETRQHEQGAGKDST